MKTIPTFNETNDEYILKYPMRFIKTVSVEVAPGKDWDECSRWLMDHAIELGANAMVKYKVYTHGTSIILEADAVFLEDPLNIVDAS